jgi:O-antigen/teichoic acid export membrane protein
MAFIAAAGTAFLLILPVLKQPAVADHLGAFWLIMIGMAARNLADFGAMALFTARRDGIMTVTNIAAVVALIVAQAALLPLAGLVGAGVAILLTFSAMAVWRFVLIFGAWPKVSVAAESQA